MKIEGTYTLHAPPGQVWHSMQNPDILRQIVPGLAKIETLDEQTFSLSLAMKQAPFVGSYQGRTTITERQYPYHFRVAIECKGDQGSLRGDIHIHLQDREEKTIIAYTGTIHLDSDGQKISTTLVRGAAKLLVQQFFTALSHQLYGKETLQTHFVSVLEHPRTFDTTGVSVPSSGSRKDLDLAAPGEEAYRQNPRRSSENARGDREREQEHLWADRLRIASAIAGLLILIWVGIQIGMHIPRRQQRK